MNRYNAKTLFIGYKIGVDSPSLHVAVTEKKLDHSCMVVYHKDDDPLSGYMIIKKGTKPVKKLRQAGVGGLPDHTLCYFLWKPYVKKENIENVLANMVQKLSPEQRADLRAKLGLDKKKIPLDKD